MSKKKLIKTILGELDMTKAARMKRAADQGFDTDKVLYHGTNQDLRSFDPEYRGTSTYTESAKKGYFATNNPDNAAEFAEAAGRTSRANKAYIDKRVAEIQVEMEQAIRRKDWDLRERLNDEWEELELGADAMDPNLGQNIIPLHARMEKPLEIDYGGMGPGEYAAVHGKGLANIIEEAKASGNYDGVIFRNIDDSAKGHISDHYVTFDPSNFRSTNAAFDPANIGKNDILGQIDPKLAAGLAGGAGAASLLMPQDAEAADAFSLLTGGAPMGSLFKKLGKKTRKAHHGSPHDFDAFDIKKIGTGEGAQAYGHGLYFTSKEEIAKYYRDALSEGAEVKWKGAPLPETVLGDMPFEEQVAFRAFRDATRYAEPSTDKSWILERAQATIDSDGFDVDINRYKDSLDFSGEGKLYTVEIPDESHMLDWDKPLSEQPESVRQAILHIPPDEQYLKGLAAPEAREFYGAKGDLAQKALDGDKEAIRAINKDYFDRREDLISGEEVYKLLGDNPETASVALRELGIPGITYKGATSNERNFVVFDDEMINLIEKGQIDPKALAALGVGAAGTAAASKLGAGDYAAGIGHGIAGLPRMLGGEFLRAGGYMNSFIGAEDPEQVDAKVERLMGKIPTILNPDDKTKQAQANILKGAAEQFQGDGSFTGLVNLLAPHYKKLPKSVRGILESY